MTCGVGNLDRGSAQKCGHVVLDKIKEEWNVHPRCEHVESLYIVGKIIK